MGIADAEAAATVRPARLIDLNRIYTEGRVLPQSTEQAMHSVEKVGVESWKFCLLLSSYFSRLQRQPLPSLEELPTDCFERCLGHQEKFTMFDKRLVQHLFQDLTLFMYWLLGGFPHRSRS